MNPIDIERRRDVSSYIYVLWTSNGCDESGLAAPFLDGRIDALGVYVSFADYFDEESAFPILPHDGVAVATTIDHHNCSDLSYDAFFENYMVANKPVIIYGLADTWIATKEWVSDAGEPDVRNLAQLFGADEVNVHVQSNAGFTRARPHTEDWTVHAYAMWWYEHCYGEAGVDDDDEQNEQQHQQQLLYLKDYTFVAKHPDYPAYDWPVYFQDDWLNEYTGSDYKFIYLGPKGTSTRLHADVLRSYSWSTNVCGVKRWYLIPPEYTFFLYDVFFQHLASDLHCPETTLYPGLQRARQVAIEVIQHKGETIFVPSGWHHSVENLAPTLSINHNWLNGTNVHWSWAKLKSELQRLLKDDTHATDTSASDGDTATSLNNSNTNCRTFRSGGSSQIADDMLLLWNILSSKAQRVLNSAGRQDDMKMLNLRACLSVLKDMRSFVLSSDDTRLIESGARDIDCLIQRIAKCLDSSITN